LAIPFKRSPSTLAIAAWPGITAAKVAGEITAVVGVPEELPPKFTACAPGTLAGAGAACGSDASEPTEVDVIFSVAVNSVFVALLFTATPSGPCELIA
jgi:hypothetical protein